MINAVGDAAPQSFSRLKRFEFQREDFVPKIPAGLRPEVAAAILRAGVTPSGASLKPGLES